MTPKKKPHGGARKGAGRPVTKEPTVVMRIPISKVAAVYMYDYMQEENARLRSLIEKFTNIARSYQETIFANRDIPQWRHTYEIIETIIEQAREQFKKD